MPKRSPSRSTVPVVEPPPPAVVNTILERGFVPSTEEYDLLAGAVMVAANAAKQSGADAIYQRLRQILGRLSQTVQAPGGLKPEQIARYRKRAADGLRERDSGKLAGGVQDLIAATCRTDPDPGEKVALYLLQLVADLLREHGNMGIEILGRLDGELGAAGDEWNAGRWPPAPEVLGWIREIIEVGIENLRADRDPWPTDGDDPDESDDGEASDGDEDEIEDAPGTDA